MERVKIPAGIERAGLRGSVKCGGIPEVADPHLLALAGALDEKALVVGGEVHGTAVERLVPDGKCGTLLTIHLPARRSPLVPARWLSELTLIMITWIKESPGDFFQKQDTL